MLDTGIVVLMLQKDGRNRTRPVQCLVACNTVASSCIGVDSRKAVTALAAEPDTSEIGWTCPAAGGSSSNGSQRMDKLVLLIEDIPVFGMHPT
jgi:hypothetical protein